MAVNRACLILASSMATSHALPAVGGDAVARLQPGGGRRAATVAASGACLPCPLAVGALDLMAKCHTLPAGRGSVMAGPQHGGGHWAPASGTSGACPPFALAVMTAIVTVAIPRTVEVTTAEAAPLPSSLGMRLRAAQRGTTAISGRLGDDDLEPRPLAFTARNGCVLAVESPPSLPRQLAAAGVGPARPTAESRLGGARTLVPRRADASPAPSWLRLRRRHDPPMTPRGVGWRSSNRSMSGMAWAALPEADRSSDAVSWARFVVPGGRSSCRDVVPLASVPWLLAVAVSTAALRQGPCVAGLAMPWTSWRGVGRLRAFAPHPEGALRPRLVPSQGVVRRPAFAPRNE